METSQAMHKEHMARVRATIVAVEKQHQLHIQSM
jgi:hypothetical protein